MVGIVKHEILFGAIVLSLDLLKLSAELESDGSNIEENVAINAQFFPPISLRNIFKMICLSNYCLFLIVFDEVSVLSSSYTDLSVILSRNGEAQNYCVLPITFFIRHTGKL